MSMRVLIAFGSLCFGHASRRFSVCVLKTAATGIRLAVSVMCVLFTLPCGAQLLPTAPALLDPAATSDHAEDDSTAVTTDGLGNWVAVWRSSSSATDYYYAVMVSRSTDNGATWTAPAFLNPNYDTDGAGDWTPQVITDGLGHWIVVWASLADIAGSGMDRDIFLSHSTDNGVTWTAPALLNSNGTTDSRMDSAPQLATDGLGYWITVWESYEDLAGAGTDLDIILSYSTDDGATWSAPEPLNSNATTDSGDDGQARIATDGAGNWVVVWYTGDDFLADGTDVDVAYCRSTDNGATWTPPALLDPNGSSDSATDIRPDIATDRAGNWTIVWECGIDVLGVGTDSDIFISRSTDNGASWTSPVSLNTNAASDSGSDYDPEIMTDGMGEWVAVWSSTEVILGAGTDSDLFVSYSLDNGATWTSPTLLNTSGTSDTYSEYGYSLATDGASHWTVLWDSPEDLNGADTDPDIFVSTFVLDVVPPTVDTVTPSSTGPTNASSIDFAVEFSENVVNFNDASDVVADHAGTASTGVTISGGPTTYTVSVEGISGDGSFTLAVATDSDVADYAQIALASSVTSAAVTIDNTAPKVSIGSPSAWVTRMGPVYFLAAYSGAEDVRLLPGDITLNTTGSATGTVSVVLTDSEPPSSPMVMISGITGDGTLGISIAGGASVDVAGNTDVGAGSSATCEVDNTAPAITVDVLSTDSATPTLTGTVSDANGVADVSVTVASSVYMATVTGSTWTCDVTNALVDGTYDLQVIATDTIGNVGTDTTADELTVSLNSGGTGCSGSSGAPRAGDIASMAAVFGVLGLATRRKASTGRNL